MIASSAALQKKHSDLPELAARTNVSRFDTGSEGDLMSFKYQKKQTETQALSHLDSSPQHRVMMDFDPSMKHAEYKESIPVSAISPQQRSKFSKFSANDAVYDLIHVEDPSDGTFQERKSKKDRKSEHSSEFYPVSQREKSSASKLRQETEEKDPFSKYDSTYSNRETIIGTRFPSVTDNCRGQRKKNLPYNDREYCFCNCRLI